jgi:hypothetical protein
MHFVRVCTFAKYFGIILLDKPPLNPLLEKEGR